MHDSRIMKDKEWYHKIIGIYQIAGGLVGILLVVWALFLTTSPSIEFDKLLPAVVFIISLSLYLFSILCGVLLYKKKKKAINLSIVNQLMQVISFSVSGFAFKYFSGLYITILIDFVSDIYSLEWGASSWHISLGDIPDSGIIGINLFAVLIVIVLSKLKLE